MKVITIYTFKGGVGKTFTATTLAEGLAKKNNKVLIIDIDPQANATNYFMGEPFTFDSEIERDGNYIKVDSGIKTLSDYLLVPDKVDELILQTKTNENIDIIPSDIRLEKTNKELLLMQGKKEKKLMTLLASKRNEYDYCIIDCPPHYSELVTNALYISDHVIIPFRSDYNSLVAYEMVKENLDFFNEEYETSFTYKGLFTGRQRNKNDMQLENIIKNDENMYQTVIRYQGNPVIKSIIRETNILDSKSGLRDDYETFINELLESER